MAEQADRRGAERYPVNADAACPLASPVAEDFGPVKIRDVSMQGVGLLLRRRVEPGTLLAVVLENKARAFSKTALVRVAHVTALPGGAFLVGGTFTAPLTYQEMSALVL
jgi:hypothetical protein